MKNIYRKISFAGCLVFLGACAPITPLPGSIPTSLPSPPSAGGAPSMPSGTPPSLPGGSPSPPGGQPGGQPSSQSGSESGSESGEQPSSDGSEGLPGGGMPGGQPSGLPGGSDPNSTGEEGEAAEPTWDIEQGGSSGAEGEGQPGGQGAAGGSDGGDDGWDTSNEIPGTPGSADAQDSDGQGDASTEGGPAGTPSGDDELEGALKDFDGEILAEREIIGTSTSTSGSGASGALELPTGADSDGGDKDVATSGGPLPPKRQIPTAPAPPPRGSESMPDNLPDARDDDIIARQLREAAMQEADPELKEKLWEEYRKYKKG